MRLWHKDLIPVLPRQQLLGQWREVCAIARNIAVKGTPNHVLVNRVMEFPPSHLWKYGWLIYQEMRKRGYKADYYKFEDWIREPEDDELIPSDFVLFEEWHGRRYLMQCLHNLQEKADCGAVPPEEWQRIVEQFPEIEKGY